MPFHHSVCSRAISFFLTPGEAKDACDSLLVSHGVLLGERRSISGCAHPTDVVKSGHLGY